MYAVSLGLLAAIAGCEEQHGAVSKNNAAQTRFPGQVTAGGGTSGEVLSQAGQATQGAYQGGTPGIAGGSGGNTGGAATGGTVQESGRGPAGSIPPPAGTQQGGTPGIASGSGGNTGGAATGGTVPQSGGSAAGTQQGGNK